MIDYEQKYQLWLDAKRIEQNAIEQRRTIEDELIKALEIDSALDGTVTKKSGPFVVKIVGRLTKKVDSDLLQEIAHENGIGPHILQALFRWKPEIDARQWKAADNTITTPLLKAITTTPSRPSFTITKEF